MCASSFVYLQVNGNLTLVDRIIGRLMDGLLQRKLDKCLNIIIVADHGELQACF